MTVGGDFAITRTAAVGNPAITGAIDLGATTHTITTGTTAGIGFAGPISGPAGVTFAASVVGGAGFSYSGD